MQSYDVIVVGGSIGGSALAANLAQAGLSVELLEREENFVDRVRGEWMAPWGVHEAGLLGIYDLLMAAGGHHVTRSIMYDELLTPDMAEVGAQQLSDLIPGTPGPLCMEHVVMQNVLLGHAEACGTTMRRGITELEVNAGTDPRVRFVHNGVYHSHVCRLVIGADGRSSSVRRQLNIALVESEIDHLISGLLVTGADEWPAHLQAFGKAGDVMLLVFPQGHGKVRLYVDYGIEQRGRYTGEEGARNLLSAYNVEHLPGGRSLSVASPCGPCRAYPSQYASVDKPYVEGAVLIGDAAGYTDPISGQGLSVTLRDARMVGDILRSNKDWTADIFNEYGLVRRELTRRISHITRFSAELFTRTDADAQTGRARAMQRLAERPELGALVAATYIGAEQLPSEAFTDEFRHALFAP